MPFERIGSYEVVYNMYRFRRENDYTGSPCILDPTAMAVVVEEPPAVAPFRKWLLSNGALMHDALYFRVGVYGLSLYTKAKLPRDSQVVSCPFNLIITAKLCRKSLIQLCRATDRSPEPFSSLGEREIVCAYLVLHWIFFGDNLNESK